MKKVILGLVATVFMGVLSVNAQDIKPSEYGFYHNEALAEFTNKYGENQKNVNFIIDEGLKLMQVKYPQLFNGVSGSSIKEMFAVNNVNDFDYKKIWNSNKENLYNINKTPRKIIDLIDVIVNSDSSYEQAMKIMNTFETSNKLTSDESNSLIAIRSVLVSSNQYWTSAMEQKRGPRPGSATLIADFAGAGMFSWTGPVAAICGFACSYITHQSDY